MSTSHPPPLPPSQSQSQPLSLPSPRDFMTSLFDNLTSPNSSSPIQTSNTNTTSASISNPHRVSKEKEKDKQNQNQNPLKQMDAQKKLLLMTLHVIFPPPLLLHALDLLDRGGVARVILREEGERGVDKGQASTGGGLGDRGDGERGCMGKDLNGAGEKELRSGRNMEVENTGVGEPTIDAHRPQNQLDDSIPHDCRVSPSVPPNKSLSPPHPSSPNHPSSNQSPPKTKQTTLYQVRSSQPSKWHSSRSASAFGPGPRAAENTYTVHLDAWNCSCAAFTFSAFPASSSSSSSYSYSYPFIPTSSTFHFPWTSELFLDLEHPIPEEKEKEEENVGEKWRYGGCTKTSQVPICKHLLACLLVERWGNMLGTYVRERVVGREEMGGWVV